MDENKLNCREREVLDYLRYERKRSDEYLRPMDVGGHDGSHHSRTLAKLHKLGLVERQTYFAWCRNVHKYRAFVTPNVEHQRPASAGPLHGPVGPHTQEK